MTDDDRALGEALRRHADELTGELTDTEPAYDAVVRRATRPPEQARCRHRRARRGRRRRRCPRRRQRHR